MNAIDAKEKIDMGRSRTASAAQADPAAAEKAAAIEAAKIAVDAAAAAVTAAETALAKARDAMKDGPANEDDAKAKLEAVTAAEDALALAKQAHAEAVLKAEAEAMRQEGDAAAEDVPALSLDITEETQLTGKALLDWLTEAPRVLLFGAAGVALAMPAHSTQAPAEWREEAGQIVFAGTFIILGDESAPRATADSVALADGPDGPVRAVSALGGPVQFAAGGEHKFSPGAFVF
jgi:trimeric autotransporter adhesin